MIDPISIGAAVAIAKTAVAGVKELISLGHEIEDCYHEIATFFDKQTEVELTIIEQKKTKATAVAAGEAPKSSKSATAEALEATFASREMIRLEKELKEALIYGSNESGLYAEMCERRDAILLERKIELAEIERLERQRLYKIQRAKDERADLLMNIAAITVGVIVSSALIYGIVLMFTYKG